MLGWGSRGAEGFFEKRHADSLCTAYSFECRWRPEFPFDHFGEKSQPNRDDFTVLYKARNRLIQKGILIVAEIARVGQSPVRPPESH